MWGNMADEKAKRYLDRFSQLRSERRSWDSRWQDVARYILPWKGRFFDRGDRPNRGDDKDDRRMEGTVTQALRRLAAGMQSGMTSPVRPWSRLRLQDEDLEKHGRVKNWLQSVEARMRRVFGSSNFYDVAHNSYTEVGAFGTTVVWEGPHPEKLLNFKLFGIGECYLDADEFGYVDTVYRRTWMNARQMVRQFGQDRVSHDVAEAYEKAPYSWFEVLYVIEPREQASPIGMTYDSVYVELGRGTLLSESGFRTFPCMIPRWDQTGSDVYGWCPGMDSLPDIKTLMAMGKSSLEAIQKTVNPPLLAPPSFKSRKICMWPGGISYEDHESSGRAEGLRPLYQVQFDVTAVEAKMQQVREALLAGFFNDLFLMIAQRPGMTATEVLERHEEKVLMLGPVVEKQQSEFLDPLMNRTFDIMWQAGRDPLGRIDPSTGWPLIVNESALQIPNPPDELRDQDIIPEYIGLLAQAQKLAGVGSIDRTMQFVGPLTQLFPNVLDNFDGDKIARHYSEMVGTPANLLRGMDDVAALRKSRAEEQQRLQQAQAEAVQIGQAKALSDIDTIGPNALTELAGAAAGTVGR